jgi:superfamily II DNA/RNA helicase
VDTIHGGKDMEERIRAIAEFKNFNMDILVATDVASKAFDFPEIHDVVNYDMHDDIENYVHRIGRTGRGKNTWVATTMINNKVEMAMLADISADRGSYCGGLGHIITTCSKLAMYKDITRLLGDTATADMVWVWGTGTY